MAYLVLSQAEQDDIIVGFMLSQERDKFCHELDLARYNKLLQDVEEGEWKNRVAKLHDDTAKRLAEVNSIIEASLSDLPPLSRIEAAKLRLEANEAKEAKPVI